MNKNLSPSALLEQTKVIAIMRGVEQERAIRSGIALAEGGVRLIEVTLNTPDALSILSAWREQLPSEVLIGAGTVMSPQMVQDAVAAGASFLITPHFDPAVIDAALERDVEIWPGVMTPTEVAAALRMGLEVVKIFPIALFGPSYIQSLKGPFEQVKPIAVGGVTPENMQDYLRAGAVGVAFGSHLFDPQSIATQNWEQIKQRASGIIQKAKVF
ncbi:2-dehydro-3-deoxyphosphogluconate aldolase / (4S)-4-hydroxy-2-oxoglutarate aldolase [Seinonella peptonophila]|uniref:2-dehydro-3-deoxyphosphogluconate aldolase / (4S)-4-hydroxy-2-oxoglutarate aldolase n=1 Tax=Seinonella peptonophila TaxID=112248 RepID=A0A1M4U415_9BACL|nr:bifunctional 4-hydroxy-2-oxoglutarate aldolase/2-dehydro-3-deoxy-phosphogluconate aldolase [Seinonella peptonophila]SHE51541.1 2-dehydro-3-deoxyphosphogluconate aldolase / (4S)-4-hydroxy-2-oxoglutarate aldolase [Seinonella peptonophila]